MNIGNSLSGNGCSDVAFLRFFLVSGTIPAFTCDCQRFVCLFTPRPKVDMCVSAPSRTMLAFENNVSCSHSSCSTPALCRGYREVNTLASTRNPHKQCSSCGEKRRNAETQGRPVAGYLKPQSHRAYDQVTTCLRPKNVGIMGKS